jgi:CheY-like chemotaxis protein
MNNNSEKAKALEHLQMAAFVALNDNELDQNTRQQLYAMIKLNLLNMSDQDLYEIAKYVTFPFELSICEKYEELKREIGDIRKTAGEWINIVPAIYEAGVKENNYKVVIIEDNLILKVAMISAFRKAGFVTLYEDQYSESLGKIMDFKPDIAVVDCELFELNGFLACYFLRHLFNIPVILVGEDASDINWDMVTLSGADHCDYKPYRWSLLPIVAKAILKRYKSTLDYNSKK